MDDSTEKFLSEIKTVCLDALENGLSPTLVITVLSDQIAFMTCEIGDSWETTAAFLRISYDRTRSVYDKNEMFGRNNESGAIFVFTAEGEEPS